MFVGKFMLSHFTNHNGEKLYNTVYVLLSYVGIKIMEDTTTLHQKKIVRRKYVALSGTNKV